MGKWIKGDVHIHSHCCCDGHVPVPEIVEQSKKFCDFLAISGHAEGGDRWGEKQYQEILEARKQYPSIPIFHTAEQEFPVERHTMFLTVPDNREFELQAELVRRYCRLAGVRGIEKACEELKFVEEHWGKEKTLMIFNHPNAPDVPLEQLEPLAKASEVFKIIACVDRKERRAKQTWDIGAEWDQLLCRGYRIYTRCGSDFHRHFTDGGHDYLPGEFVQDHLLVEENSYEEILRAYRTGRFFCTVDNLIENPVFHFTGPEAPAGAPRRIHLEFQIRHPLEEVDLIADGCAVRTFRGLTGHFETEETLPPCTYCRVRGRGKPRKRKYEEGCFEPVFLLNPIFPEDAPCS